MARTTIAVEAVTVPAGTGPIRLGTRAGPPRLEVENSTDIPPAERGQAQRRPVCEARPVPYGGAERLQRLARGRRVEQGVERAGRARAADDMVVDLALLVIQVRRGQNGESHRHAPILAEEHACG